MHDNRIGERNTPALQVRDFPDALYEDLREYAARHHRSMAQQTVDAVERLIHKEAHANNPDGPRVTGFDCAEERSARAAKREEILRRAAERRMQIAKKLPSPVTLLTAARDERDQDFSRVMADIASEPQ